MAISDIYRDNILKYPLNDKEYFDLDDVWEFLDIFKREEIFVTDYRKRVIKTINKKYKIDDFYYYESILNKMFWNLRWLIFPMWYKPEMTEEDYNKFIKNDYGKTDTIPHSLLLCTFEKYTDEKDLRNKLDNNQLFQSMYYRSFINKLIIVDKKRKIIMSKPFEGSSHIFSKNYFNLLTMTILFDRSLYEKIMKNPYSAKHTKIEFSEHYYEYDYGFPNINFCTYDFGTVDDKMERIKKMYYNKYGKKRGEKNKRKSEYWFKLII